jgi:hypothetical protein
VFTASANLAEVSALATKALRPPLHFDPPAQSPARPAPDGARAANPRASTAAIGTVTSVIIDLVTGMLSHAADPSSAPITLDVE